MQNRETIKAPISVIDKFCAEDDERKQMTLVRSVKNRSGSGGGDRYATLKGILRTSGSVNHDISSLRKELNGLIATNQRDRDRLVVLSEAFLSQWQRQDYNFFRVHGTVLKIARLTIKVFPTWEFLLVLGMKLQSGCGSQRAIFWTNSEIRSCT